LVTLASCYSSGILAAYKKMALKYHPDKNRDDPKAADRFVLVNKAKTYLMDDVSRRHPSLP
jgi:DnaJ-class molecular chaperone